MIDHINAGMSAKDVHATLLKEADSLPEARVRDRHVHSREVRNMISKIHAEWYKKAQDDKESDPNTSLSLPDDLPDDEPDAEIEHPGSLEMDGEENQPPSYRITELLNEAIQEVRRIISEGRIEELQSALAKHRELDELLSVYIESFLANAILQTQRRS